MFMFECLYVDNLFTKLKESGHGCFIGPHYYGALGYADDIVLLCPSVSGMNKMLNICSDYAERHSILFNTKKSQVIYFPYKRKKQEKAKLCLKEENLKYVHSAKHLGHNK